MKKVSADGRDYAKVEEVRCPSCKGPAERTGDGAIRCLNFVRKIWGITELQGCGLFFGQKAT